MMNAAKMENKPEVERLKEVLGLIQAEGHNYEEKKYSHERELYTLQERCVQVDNKIYEMGVTQLPTTEEGGQL